MKTTHFVRWVAVGVCWPLALVHAQVQSPVGNPAAAVAAVQEDLRLVALAHQSASRGDAATAEAQLLPVADPTTGTLPANASVILARRTMAVCGWLRDDGNYAGAVQLAERMIQRLATAREANETDHVERLYWEALLEGDILGHKGRALDLLEEAEKLAPDDERILSESLRWSGAVAEFGR